MNEQRTGTVFVVEVRTPGAPWWVTAGAYTEPLAAGLGAAIYACDQLPIETFGEWYWARIRPLENGLLREPTDDECQEFASGLLGSDEEGE